jgi:hypothetical protein
MIGNPHGAMFGPNGIEEWDTVKVFCSRSSFVLPSTRLFAWAIYRAKSSPQS